MPKRLTNVHSLKRNKIRPDMNKFNLVNAMKWQKGVRRGTMFQQQFVAKSESRAYHGPHLTETQWRNIYRGELNGVNPLKSTKEAESAGKPKETPWALQTYLPTERRLDTAVYRSFFASSVRQAHQFIVKGKVHVNGVKIKHPGYELKSGDLFRVDPESVLYAMGRKKPSVQESVQITNRIIKKYNSYLARAKKHPLKYFRLKQHTRSKHGVYNQLYQRKQKKKVAEHNKTVQEKMRKELEATTAENVFKTIVKHVPFFEKYGTLPLGKDSPVLNKALSVFAMVHNQQAANNATQGATTKQIKGFKETAPESTVNGLYQSYYSKDANDGPGNKGDVKKLVQEVIKIKQDQIRSTRQAQIKKADASIAKYDPKWAERLPEKVEPVDASAAEEEGVASVPNVNLPFSDGKLYGLSEPSKQYFTPWTPRPFIAPFAVLPHHIEISFKSCHAVYLRDPVARPGHSEIISPFPLDMHERAHMFYNRKRRKNL